MVCVPSPQSFEDLIEALAEKGINPHSFIASSPHISHPFLLKGIAKGWWDIHRACFNPNLRWDWIEEHLSHPHSNMIQNILIRNRTISWPQLRTLLERPGVDVKDASDNPIMPFSYILEHPEVDWQRNIILRRDDYTPENAALFSRMKGEVLVSPGELTYDMMRIDCNHTQRFIYSSVIDKLSHHPIDRILDDIQNGSTYDIWGAPGICRHPDFKPEMMKAHPDINWSWYPMQSKNMTKEDMLAIFKPPISNGTRASYFFWSHPSITLDMIGTVEPFSVDGLAYNPNLTWDFIIENAEMFRRSPAFFARSDWSKSEEIVRRRREAAVTIQRWYKRVAIFDLTYPRAEKKFRLAMEKMYP